MSDDDANNYIRPFADMVDDMKKDIGLSAAMLSIDTATGKNFKYLQKADAPVLKRRQSRLELQLDEAKRTGKFKTRQSSVAHYELDNQRSQMMKRQQEVRRFMDEQASCGEDVALMSNDGGSVIDADIGIKKIVSTRNSVASPVGKAKPAMDQTGLAGFMEFKGGTKESGKEARKRARHRRRQEQFLDGEENLREDLRLYPPVHRLLPVRLLRKFDSEQPDLAQRRRARPKILIVDGNLVHLAACKIIFEKYFEIVQCASTADQAVDLVDHIVFDIVLVAVDLPGELSGLDLVDAIRHVEQKSKFSFRTLVVAMMTVQQSRDQTILDACFCSGMDRFLLKPAIVFVHLLCDLMMSGTSLDAFRRLALETKWTSSREHLVEVLGNDADARSAVIGILNATGTEEVQQKEATALIHDPNERQNVDLLHARQRNEELSRIINATVQMKRRISELEYQVDVLEEEKARKAYMESRNVATLLALESRIKEAEREIHEKARESQQHRLKADEYLQDLKNLLDNGCVNAAKVAAAKARVKHFQRIMEANEQCTMLHLDLANQNKWNNYFGDVGNRSHFEIAQYVPKFATDASASWYRQELNDLMASIGGSLIETSSALEELKNSVFRVDLDHATPETVLSIFKEQSSALTRRINMEANKIKFATEDTAANILMREMKFWEFFESDEKSFHAELRDIKEYLLKRKMRGTDLSKDTQTDCFAWDAQTTHDLSPMIESLISIPAKKIQPDLVIDPEMVHIPSQHYSAELHQQYEISRLPDYMEKAAYTSTTLHALSAMLPLVRSHEYVSERTKRVTFFAVFDKIQKDEDELRSKFHSMAKELMQGVKRITKQPFDESAFLRSGSDLPEILQAFSKVSDAMAEMSVPQTPIPPPLTPPQSLLPTSSISDESLVPAKPAGSRHSTASEVKPVATPHTKKAPATPSTKTAPSPAKASTPLSVRSDHPTPSGRQERVSVTERHSRSSSTTTPLTANVTPPTSTVGPQVAEAPVSLVPMPAPIPVTALDKRDPHLAVAKTKEIAAGTLLMFTPVEESIAAGTMVPPNTRKSIVVTNALQHANEIVEGIASQCASLQKENEDLSETLKAANDRVDEEIEKSQRLEAKVSSLEKLLLASQKEASDNKAALDASQLSQAQLAAEIETLKNRVNTFFEKITKLTTDNVQLNDLVSRLQSQLAYEINRVAALTSQLESKQIVPVAAPPPPQLQQQTSRPQTVDDDGEKPSRRRRTPPEKSSGFLVALAPESTGNVSTKTLMPFDSQPQSQSQPQLRQSVANLNGILVAEGSTRRTLADTIAASPGNTLPAGYVLPKGAALSPGTRMPEGTVLPEGATLPPGSSVAPGTVFPPGTVIPNGTVFPRGTVLPAGTFFPPGTVVQLGTILPEGTVISDGAVLPAGTTITRGTALPPGTVLPQGSVIVDGTNLPPGTVLPMGTILPSGTNFTMEGRGSKPHFANPNSDMQRKSNRPPLAPQVTQGMDGPTMTVFSQAQYAPRGPKEPRDELPVEPWDADDYDYSEGYDDDSSAPQAQELPEDFHFLPMLPGKTAASGKRVFNAILSSDNEVNTQITALITAKRGGAPVDANRPSNDEILRAFDRYASMDVQSATDLGQLHFKVVGEDKTDIVNVISSKGDKNAPISSRRQLADVKSSASQDKPPSRLSEKRSPLLGRGLQPKPPSPGTSGAAPPKSVSSGKLDSLRQTSPPLREQLLTHSPDLSLQFGQPPPPKEKKKNRLTSLTRHELLAQLMSTK